MSDQVVPSADSWILPANVGDVPVTAPTCCTAKHRPSPASRSPVAPLWLAVMVRGVTPTLRTAWRAKSWSFVDMGGSGGRGLHHGGTEDTEEELKHDAVFP